jgi:nitronate monooxygenase
MGTRFISTRESLASDAYRQILVESSLNDVLLTRAFIGLTRQLPAVVGRAVGH